jgi:hypothetical protein
MPIGKPFQPGQPKPPNSGRKKGQQSKPRNLRERIERRRALREAALDQLYVSDPKRALELDAQLHRDDVQLMRFEQDSEVGDGRMPETQIARLAREQGAISDDECTRAYAAMVQGDTDEARVIAARIALSDRDQLPGVMRDCRALRKAVAASRFRVQAEVTAAELVRALGSVGPAQARQASTTTAEVDPWRHAGIPLGDGARLIPATPPQFRQPPEPYADPPHVPPPIDAEPVSPPRASPARKARDPWDDPSVTIVMRGRPR